MFQLNFNYSIKKQSVYILLDDSLIGEFDILLYLESQTYTKQIEFTEEFELKSPYNKTPGKINCNILWIYSKVLQLESSLQKIRKLINDTAEAKDKFEKFFRFLSYPGFVAYNQSQFTINLNPINSQMMKDNIDPFIDSKAEALVSKVFPNYHPKWGEICQYALLIYVSLSAAIMLYRSDFLNVQI